MKYVLTLILLGWLIACIEPAQAPTAKRNVTSTMEMSAGSAATASAAIPTPQPMLPLPTPTIPAAPTTQPSLPTSTTTPSITTSTTAQRTGTTVTTLLGRQVDVAVMGFSDNSLRFTHLVQAINEEERILGVPYPSPAVTLELVNELPGGFCGHNRLSYAARYRWEPYTVDDSTISMRIDETCPDPFATIAHEVGHTWFHSNANWIDEGLADAIEHQVIESFSEGQEIIYPPLTYCESYRNISELERAVPDKNFTDQNLGYSCNYRLGDGIFGDLRTYYSDSEFNKRIAQLASNTRREHTITDVKEVFGEDGSALDIVNLWYDGQPEMRRFRHLDAVAWTHPPTIDGDYLHFAGKTEPEVVLDFVLGKDPYCSQFVLYDNTEDQEWVANVRDPLLAGWSDDEIPKVIVVNHYINSMTGEFSVTSKINNNSLANINDLSLAVKSRVVTGTDGFCNKSINYSQVAVTSGSIPSDLKVTKHHHLDAIEWINPPTVSRNTLSFSGKALPGTIQLTWQEGYCGQLVLYEYDDSGYHRIDSLNPLLPGGRHWTGQITGEVTSQHISTDGTFEALVRLSDNALTGYQNPMLLVRTQAAVNSGANKCGESEVLSAIGLVIIDN